MSTLPPVSVIILNFNGAEHLPYSLPSICATDYSNIEILLVDNASSDDSATMASRFPVRTLVNARNLGWSGGNNVGIRHALESGARYIVLANNDIRVHPQWVAEAVRLSESDPDVAVIGFDVYEPGPGDDDPLAAYTTACRQWTSGAIATPAYVGGMAMFVRSSVFDELGLIDDNFFAYGEENDFQIRVRKAGYSVVSVNVPVWHYGLGSFRRMPFRASLLQTENNIQLLVKHRGLAALPRAAWVHLTGRIFGRSQPASSAVERRLQSSSPVRAAVLAPIALIRIVAKLPSIVRRRREDERRIAAVRTRRLSERRV